VKISYLSTILLTLSLFTTETMAAEAPVRIVGNLPAKLIINTVNTPAANTNKHRAAGAVKEANNHALNTEEQEASEVKSIMLQHVVLSVSAQKYLAEKASAEETPAYLMSAADNTSTAKVDLRMNNVPVLDQGMHGACVTFATTAILDAIYSKGDYISQLCNLELSATLYPSSAAGPHGWEGSSNFIIVDQIKRYGVISKQYQHSMGCAGIKEYPLYDRYNWGNPMTAEEFKSHSEPVTAIVATKTILDMSNAFSTRTSMSAAFTKVKLALANGHRVLIGYLVDLESGGVGAFGKVQVSGDTWVMTPTIKKDIVDNKVNAGHAIIITGYDDNALVVNIQNGSVSRGAFKLRNSWGKYIGDRGEFYMSYDYFKMMADEAIEILPA